MHILFSVILLVWSLCTLVTGDVNIGTPLASQLPPIAHTQTQYTWTISADTFRFAVQKGSQAPPSPPTLVYDAKNLPSWLSFNAASRTFSGDVPANGDGQSVSITVTASLPEGQSNPGGSTSASDTFTLLTLSDPAPTLKIPIDQQLGTAANSLGKANILPNSVLHIPLGWSFSVGLEGDTFTLPDDDEVFWSANLLGSLPLPSWMTWDADAYNLYGVAPNQAGSDGDSFDVVFTGSNRPHFGGTSDVLHIRVSHNALTVDGTLPAANASIGVTFNHTISQAQLRLDGRANPASNKVAIKANLTDYPWLSFDEASSTLSGVPPFQPYGKADDATAIQVPIIFSDSHNNSLAANQTINVQPFPFTAQTLPNIFIEPGKAISVSLGGFLRTSNQTASKRSMQARAAESTQNSSPTLTTSFDPATASSWLSFNEASKYLTGTVPNDFHDRVKVSMQSNTTNGLSGPASFYLAQHGDSPTGNPTVQSSPNDGGSKLGMKQRIAIGASLGGIAALIAVILLVCCYKRRKSSKSEVIVPPRHGLSPATDFDDRTLTDKAHGGGLWKKAKVFQRKGDANTPSTLAAPLPDEKQTPHSGEANLQSVIVESPNGGRRDATHESDMPVQTGILANLFGDKKKNARQSGTGLGLTLNGVDPFDPEENRRENRIRHQRSRESIMSHRSSWESDLFYEDAQAERASNHSEHSSDAESNDVANIPVRRGKGATVRASALNFRHRNKHINESPAFFANDAFSPDQKDGSSHSVANMAAPMLADSSSSGHSSEFDNEHDANLGPDYKPPVERDAQIMQARYMQVQRHSPMLHTGSLNPFERASHQSQDAIVANNSFYNDNPDNAFDDADDDASAFEWPGSDIQHEDVTAQQRNRNSALSAFTDGSHQRPKERVLMAASGHDPTAVTSPNPSFMDGSSVTNFDPRETVKAIPRPKTPPQKQRTLTSDETPKAALSRTPKRNSADSSRGSTSSRHLPCPYVPCTVGYLLSFHLYPNKPPPMAGAPSSPGKRSGRNARYELIVDDQRPHLVRYRGTWPNMFSDWLSLDQSTFEVAGVVPKNSGLDTLGDCEIALISTSRLPGPPPSPTQRPGLDRKRTSNSSYESAYTSHTPVGDDEIEVVARARLVFHAGHGKAF